MIAGLGGRHGSPTGFDGWRVAPTVVTKLSSAGDPSVLTPYTTTGEEPIMETAHLARAINQDRYQVRRPAITPRRTGALTRVSCHPLVAALSLGVVAVARAVA